MKLNPSRCRHQGESSHLLLLLLFEGSCESPIQKSLQCWRLLHLRHRFNCVAKMTPKQKASGLESTNNAIRDISLTLSIRRGSHGASPHFRAPCKRSSSPDCQVWLTELKRCMARKMPAKASFAGTPPAKEGTVHLQIIISPSDSALAGHSTA